ncbi:hypothetical protein [Paraburkholderia dipogonis]|jgi:hypothetical protein|uniref:hypothetical protein n=1 Tax=Paraburkholderia dipogonis TaxID=1211383 RepID=UPI0038B9F95B
MGAKILKFQPGKTGNPRGRPKSLPDGVRIRKRDVRTPAEKYLEKHAEELMKLAVEVAKGAKPEADTAMLKTLIDRSTPTVRPTSKPVVWPGVKATNTLERNTSLVLAHVANGGASAAEAAEFLGVLKLSIEIAERGNVVEQVAAIYRAKGLDVPPEIRASLVAREA